MSEITHDEVAIPPEQNTPRASDDDLQREIESIFLFCDGDRINKCYATFEILEGAPDSVRPKLIKTAAEYKNNAQSSEELHIPVKINSDESSELQNRLGSLVDELLEFLLRENKPEEQLYRDVWDLTQNPIFRDKKSQVFAFYWVIIDKRIPYFHIGPGYRMSNDDWQALTKRLTSKLAKIRFLLATDFGQQSEESSLILQEIDELDNKEDKIRALAFVISVLRTEKEAAADAYQELLKRSGLR